LLGSGRGLIKIRLGRDSLFPQPPRALQVEVRQVALGLGRRQLRRFLAGVELHQRIAGPDHPAGIEADLPDNAGQVGAHRDAVDRRHRADAVEGPLPRFLPGHDGGDGLGGRLEGGRLGSRRLNLPVFHEADDR